MSEATLKAKLTGDSAEFQRSLREGIDAAREFGNKVGDSIRETVVQVAALTLGVESVKEAFERAFEGVKGVFELSKELEHLSDRTGIATKDLMQLQTEFKLSGLQADQVGTTINRMQRSIENAADKGGEAAQVFSRLGVNIYELQRMNPAEQFETIRSRLAAIEDPARRAQVAMQMFGRQGAEMLSLFKNEGVGKEASDALGQQADIMARNTETFQEVASLMEIAGIKMQGFFVGMAEPIGRVILPVLKSIESLDLSKWGQSIGNNIATSVRVLYNAFESNKLGDLLYDSIAYGAAKGGNDLIGIAKMFGQAMEEISKNAQFGKGLGDILEGAADVFVGTMMQWLDPFSDSLTAVMNKAADTFALGFWSLVKDIPGMGGSADSHISSILGSASSRETPEGVKAAHEDLWRTQQRMAVSQNLESQLNQIDPNRKNEGDGFNIQRPPDIQKRMREAEQAAQDQLAQINSAKLTSFGTINGASSEDFITAGKSLIEKGGQNMAQAMDGLVKKIENIKFAPGSALDSSKYKSELTDLLKSFDHAISGEGKENAPDAARKGGGIDFFGGAATQGIHKNDDGGWSFFSGSSQGGVNFGDDGMAGRAGRVVASPEGKDPGIHLSEMNANIKDIKSIVSNGLQLA